MRIRGSYICVLDFVQIKNIIPAHFVAENGTWPYVFIIAMDRRDVELNILKKYKKMVDSFWHNGRCNTAYFGTFQAHFVAENGTWPYVLTIAFQRTGLDLNILKK